MRALGTGLCFVMIAAGVFTAALVLAARSDVEKRYNQVELVVDYDEVAELARSQGASVPQVLRQLRDRGITSAALNEETLPLMLDAGRAWRVEGAPGLRIAVGGPMAVTRIEENLRIKWPSAEMTRGPGGSAAFGFDVPLEALTTVGVGWRQETLYEVVAAGLIPVARPIDSPRIDSKGLRFTFEEIAATGMQRVLFAGKFVLGNGELLPETAELLDRHDLAFYAVELETQEGTAELTALLDCRVVRTHSIGDKEMLRQAPLQAQRRFARAVRERNVRCCFVHLFLDRAMADPLQYNLDYVEGISQALTGEGYELAMAPTFPVFDEGHKKRVPLALGVAGGLGLLAVLLFPLSGGWVLALSVGFAAALSGFVMVEPLTGRMMVALLATLVFPLIAAAVYWRAIHRADRGEGAVSRAATAVGVFVAASMWSLVGGVLAGALLSESEFMVKALQFRGTKLSQLGPVAGVAALIVLGALAPAANWKEYLGRLRERLNETWKAPFTVGYAAIAVVILGAGAYWILRTGNQPPSAAAAPERDLREALETLLVYRPRTKEFLLAHPAMVLGGFLALMGRRYWLGLCAVVGMVGQASMVNTFCHIHSPLLASLVRTLYGLLLGVALGVVVMAVVGLWWRIVGQEGREADTKESA